jgi:hypothetical protein
MERGHLLGTKRPLIARYSGGDYFCATWCHARTVYGGGNETRQLSLPVELDVPARVEHSIGEQSLSLPRRNTPSIWLW